MNEALLREKLASLDEDDFLFSVEVLGAPWDVYRIYDHGTRGVVALRIVDDELEIGLWEMRTMTPKEVEDALLAGAAN